MVYSLYEHLLWIVYMAGCIGGGYNIGNIIGGLVTKTDVPMRRVLNAITGAIVAVITTYIHSKYY